MLKNLEEIARLNSEAIALFKDVLDLDLRESNDIDEIIAKVEKGATVVITCMQDRQVVQYVAHGLSGARLEVFSASVRDSDHLPLEELQAILSTGGIVLVS